MDIEFIDISKEELESKVRSKSKNILFGDVPAKFARQEIDKRIRAIYIIQTETGDSTPTVSGDGAVAESRKLAPYLCCGQCYSLQLWYKFVSNKWVNQSGVKGLKTHLDHHCKTNKRPATVSQNHDLKKMLEAQNAPKKRKVLDESQFDKWKDHVVDLLSLNPTVSISAHARVVSSAANYAAGLTHSAGVLSNFSIGRTSISEHIVRRGKEAQMQLKQIYSVAASRPDCETSCLIDYWSARHRYLTPYAGVIGCGIDENFQYFEFPLCLKTLDDESKDAVFTFNFLKNELNFASFSSPLFVCTDNEAKMKAAYDGRYDDENFNFGGRVGCTEHSLSTCIEYVFEKCPHQALKDLLQQMSTIENFYNRRQGLAKQLPFSIPEKSTTRPWRFFYTRFNSFVGNYFRYQECSEPVVVDSLPQLPKIREVLDVLTDAKFFFDKMEADGPTAHLSYLNFLALDVKLLRKQTGINSKLSISTELAKNLREEIGDKLWPYCGSPLAKAAAYLTGVNVLKVIRKNIAMLPAAAKTDRLVQDTCKQWMSEGAVFDRDAKNYIKQILHQLPSSGTSSSAPSEASTSVQKKDADLFDTFFEVQLEPQTVGYRNTNAHQQAVQQIDAEFQKYEATRTPSTTPLAFWKTATIFPLLRQSARFILAVKTSSATIERLFSNAGIILSKLRRCTKPDKLAALLFIKYAIKYNDLFQSVKDKKSPDEAEDRTLRSDNFDLASSDDE